MSNDVEYVGQWFTSDNPEINFAGKLVINDVQKPYLTIQCPLANICDFLEESSNDIRNLKSHIILGSSSSKNITLYNCIGHATSISNNIFLITLYPDIIFLGIHFYHQSTLRIKYLVINFIHLNYWIDKNGFQFIDSDNILELNIKYIPPENIVLFNNDDLKIYISFKNPGPSFSRSFQDREINVKQQTSIIIESDKGISINGFIYLTYLIQDFLTFSITKPVSVLEIKSYIDIKFENKKVYGPRPIIDIIYRSIEYPTKINSSANSRLFYFSNIESNIQDHFSLWLANADILRPVYKLYFQTLFNLDYYLEQQIINLILAIEAYYKRYNKKNKLNIILKELINDIPRDIFEYIITDFNEKQFIKQVIYIRNKLIHPDIDYENIVMDVNYMSILKNQLTNFVIIIILRKIGFSNESISELMERRLRVFQ